MPTRTELRPLAAPLRASLRAWSFNALFRWVLALEAYAEDCRQRRALLALSDRTLKDIGLSRAAAEGIATKPASAGNGVAAGAVSCRRVASSSRRE